MFFVKRQILLASVLTMSSAYAAQDFVLKDTQPQKKYSTSKLKELIGQETKELFNQTTTMGITLADIHEKVASLHKTTLTSKTAPTKILEKTATLHGLCGKINKELAFVQQHCSSLIESLVDDCPPFKKATKNDLNEAFTSLGDVKKTMMQTITTCQRWCQEAHDVTATGKAIEKKMDALCKNLDTCAATLTSARTTMNGKQCLKVA